MGDENVFVVVNGLIVHRVTQRHCKIYQIMINIASMLIKLST